MFNAQKRRQSPTSDIEIISDTHGLVTSGKDRNGVVQAVSKDTWEPYHSP